LADAASNCSSQFICWPARPFASLNFHENDIRSSTLQMMDEGLKGTINLKIQRLLGRLKLRGTTHGA
jgi:hypothetical protein